MLQRRRRRRHRRWQIAVGLKCELCYGYATWSPLVLFPFLFFSSLKQLSCDMQSTLFQSTTEYLPPVIQLQPDTSSRPRRWTHAALTYFLHPSMAVATFCSAMVTYWKVRYAGRPSTGSLFLCLSHGLAPAGSGVVGSKILPLEKKTEKYPGFSSPCSELFQRFRCLISVNASSGRKEALHLVKYMGI